MLDECKGERLEEVLAVFSNAVLKKVVQNDQSGRYEAIAQSLALENFSYQGERTILSTLILAHKSSISTGLASRHQMAARYRDFSDLLDLNKRRIMRRHEQLKQTTMETHTQERLPLREVTSLQSQTQKMWSGSEDWLDIVLYGNSRGKKEGVLSEPFDVAWLYAERGYIGSLEAEEHNDLLKDLDSRVKSQQARLATWKQFGESLSKGQPISSSPERHQGPAEARKIDLGFDAHQQIQLSSDAFKLHSETTDSTTMPRYTRLINDMRDDLANVNRPKPSMHQRNLAKSNLGTQPSLQDRPRSRNASANDNSWSSVSSDDEGITSALTGTTTKAIIADIPTPSGPPAKDTVQAGVALLPTPAATSESAHVVEADALRQTTSYRPTTASRHRTPSPNAASQPSIILNAANAEEDLADKILTSMAASSSSPKKPRQTLSLADRTRISMSRASHTQYSDLHDEVDGLPDLARLSINPQRRGSVKTPSEEPDSKHGDLLERTRKNMAGFEAAQKKAHLDRRRSVKEAKKKQRESSYFPKVEEELTSEKGIGIDLAELIEGQADFESVFKSRPKIKTSPVASPAVSPTRVLEGELEP